jgi:hypothetical protein
MMPSRFKRLTHRVTRRRQDRRLICKHHPREVSKEEEELFPNLFW